MELFLIVAGAATTAAVCANAYSIGARLGVLAQPDQERRLHVRPTPQIGGIGILAGLLLWTGATYLLNGAADLRLIAAIVVCAVGIGAVGFADDQTGLSPIARVIMIFVFIGVALLLDRDFIPLRLNWGSFEPTQMSVTMFVPLIALTSGGVVNAVNMADGQDGVVGSMFVVWTICLMFCTGGTSQEMAAVICVSSLIFLTFNLRGKVFLGDCGSYGVTFVLGLLVTLAHARGQITLETIMVWFFVPVADCLRLLITRPLRGVSPFLGDRDHFHHRLEDKMGKQKGLACYVGTVAVSSLIATLEPRFALVCLCVVSAIYFSFAWLTDAQLVQQTSPKQAPASPTNVVSISDERSAIERRKGAA